MTQYRLRTTALDEAGCAAVHAATLEVLEKTGVEVQHERALGCWQGRRARGRHAGADPGRRSWTTRSPPRRAAYTLTSRCEAGGLELRGRPGLLRHRLRLPVPASGPDARDRRPVVAGRRRGDGGPAGEAAQHRLRDEHGAPARARRRASRRSPSSRPCCAARPSRSSWCPSWPPTSTSSTRWRRSAAPRTAGRVYAMPTPPLVHGEHSAGAPRALRRARRPHGLRHGAAAGRDRARLPGRLPRADQRRDAQRARDHPAGEARARRSSTGSPRAP